MAVNAGITEFYHPLLAKRDLLFPLRTYAPLGILAVAVAVLTLWVLRRPLPAQHYKIAFACAVSITVIVSLPPIDNDYTVEFDAGTRQFAAPWQYKPVIGKSVTAKQGFLRISVVGNDLQPEYTTQSDDIFLSVSRGQQGSFDPAAPLCAAAAKAMDCEWHYGGLRYTAFSSESPAPLKPEQFKSKVVALFDSFETVR